LAAPLKTDDCEADGVKVATVALLAVVEGAALSGMEVVDVVPGREALVVGTLAMEAGVDEAAAAELGDAVGVSETRELVRLYAAAQLTRDIPCGC
jgi:hypothetical protein